MVDVRDVAKAHILAMQTSESDSERIILSQQPGVQFINLCHILADEFKPQGYNPPTMKAPCTLVWIYSFFNVEAKASLPRLNRHFIVDNEKVK
jgi:nucleoside-diphosphate-sugar epimerase